MAALRSADVLPQARYNLTKTVRKRPIDGAGSVVGEWYVDRAVDIKHEARTALRALRCAACGLTAALCVRMRTLPRC